MKIFKKNNHSKYVIGWKRIGAKKANEIKKMILENYNFDFVSAEIKQVKEWERMSNNFRVKIKINGKSKEVLFRKHIQIRDEKNVEFLNKITKFLKNNDILIPDIISVNNGNSFFKEKENFYVIYEFVSGNHFKGSVGELKEIASNIALLHKVLKRVPFQKEIKKRPVLLPSWTIQGWENIFYTAGSKKDKLDREIIKNKELILEAAQKIIDNSGKLNKLEKQIIHADLHPQNTLFRKEKLIAFLDFEGLRESELLRDVGNACHRFVRQFVVFQGKDFKKTLSKGIKIFLEKYNKINPLKENEMNLIPLLISDEILRKLYKDINLYCSKGDLSRIEGGELAKKINLLKESEIIANYIK